MVAGLPVEARDSLIRAAERDGESRVESRLEGSWAALGLDDFDVNPERRRSFRRYHNYCRISFGPEMDSLRQGLDALERVIAQYR